MNWPTLRVLTGTAWVLLVSLAGCARHLPAYEPLPDIPATPSGFSALLHATWAGPEGKRRAQVALAYLAPDRIRLEILAPGGTARAVLVSSPEGAMLLDVNRRTYRPVLSGRQGMEALVHIPAPPEMIGWLLLGPEPLKTELPCQPAVDDSGAEGWTCPLAGGERIRLLGKDGQRAEIHPESGPPAEILWNADPQGGRKPPRTLQIVQKDPEADLRVSLVDLRFADPPLGLFSLEPPQGFSREDPGDSPWTP
ncbi:MAG TPA: hypothetical protein VGR38_05690 [Candidatus Polarisedimenticolia bacterium]|nr:hypothetical protein [Candidatus Polarisedimenticolia bacterium]